MPYTGADVRARDMIGRILLCAPPKAGKTMCAVGTSPGPVFVFNSDGKGGLDPVALRGIDFEAEDVISMATFERAYNYVRANSSRISTVVFDNLTTFVAMLEAETKKELKPDGSEPDGRQYYPLVKSRIMTSIRTLFSLPQHVVVCAHTDIMTASSGAFGHILAISGGAKQLIPVVVQDWVWLELTVNPDTGATKREFLLAPQGNWTKGVRSVKDVSRCDANISTFLELAKSHRALKPQPPQPKTTQTVTRVAPTRPAAVSQASTMKRTQS